MRDIFLQLFGHEFLIPRAAYQVGLAALLGLLIGAERAWRKKVASLRTFSMMSVGSCIFTLLSVEASGAEKHDITRIAAQVVTGVGFIGGGVIFKSTDRIEGVTTAAMLWLAVAIGMACGFNQIEMAIWSFIAWAFINLVSSTLHRMIDSMQASLGAPNHCRVTLQPKPESKEPRPKP
jgi:putative Mg2+ transporter-C (MgtC) family protein